MAPTNSPGTVPEDIKKFFRSSDAADEGSPPRDGVTFKKTRSKVQPKKRKRVLKPPTKNVLVVGTDDESVIDNGPVVDGFEALEAAERAEAAARTPHGKRSRSRAATRTRRRSGSASEYDNDDNRIVDAAAESDSPQCGRGDPNLSGISPPLPASLVEPKAQGFETGFHVITGGTEVGISAFKGIADSLIDCHNSSMASFPTWTQAHGYYSVCFAANSVHIRQPRDEQTPIHSPIRKKTKLRLTRAELARTRAAIIQPHFAPAMNRSGSPPLDSECCPRMSANHQNRLHHGALVAAHDPVADLARSINSSYFQVRADAIARAKSVEKDPHHGAQATATQSQPQDPVSSPPTLRPIVVVVDSSDDDETQSQPQYPVSSPPISRPIVVVIDSSDDEMTATNLEHKNRNGPALPVASSSLIVEVNSDPPTTLAESPTIIVYDSEEELIFPDSDTERMLNYLQGGIRKPGPTPRGHRRL